MIVACLTRIVHVYPCVLIYWYSLRIPDYDSNYISFHYNVVQFILHLSSQIALLCTETWRMPERQRKTQIGSLSEVQRFGPQSVSVPWPWDTIGNGTNDREVSQKYHEQIRMICHDLLLVSIVYYLYLLGLCHSVEPDKDFRRAQLEAEQQLALATRQAEVEQGIRSGIRIASKRN